MERSELAGMKAYSVRLFTAEYDKNGGLVPEAKRIVKSAFHDYYPAGGTMIRTIGHWKNNDDEIVSEEGFLVEALLIPPEDAWDAFLRIANMADDLACELNQSEILIEMTTSDYPVREFIECSPAKKNPYEEDTDYIPSESLVLHYESL